MRRYIDNAITPFAHSRITELLLTMSSISRDPNFSELLNHARNDRASGIGRLLDSFRPLLQQLAKRKISSRLQARMSESDLIQETMLSACQGLKGFQGNSQGEFQCWLLRILRSRLIDGLRRHLMAECRMVQSQSPESFRHIADNTQSPSSLVAIDERSNLLVDALMHLSDIDRSIVLMRYSEQLGFQEIANRTGLPLANVWRRWSRSIDSIRRRLHQD